MYRPGSLRAAGARELENYKLDLTGLQEFRWDQMGTVRAGNCNFFYGKRNENQLETGLSVQHRLASSVKRVELVSDRVSYIVLRGR